ncbi:MAG: MG2 domain-containing protein [Gammaproteobacteria bacterium]|nr:MG2 domain-containing protein [Gammaproteobacteria bacterium]
MIIQMIAVSLLVLVCCNGINGQANTTGKPLKVRAIYPAGVEVATSDRITIEFNQNVVALGASMFIDDVVPIDIEPAVDCEWNWVKLNTLQCELPIDDDLDGATRYKVIVRPGITAPNGHMMSDDYVHVFETAVPSMNVGQIVSWKSPTEPIIRVIFNQSVEIDSLRDRLLLVDSVSGTEISTTICPTDWRFESNFRDDFFGRKQSYQVFERENCDRNRNHDDSVVILPNERLTPNANVSLLLLPGVKGTAGDLLSKERELVETNITTFGDFRFLGLTCKDVYGNDQFQSVDQLQEHSCSVSSNIVVHFSSRFHLRWIDPFVHTEPTIEVEDTWWLSGWRQSRGNESFDYAIRGDFRPNTSYRLYVAAADQEDKEADSLTPAQDGFGRPLNGTNEITFRIGRPHPTLRLVQTHVVVDSHSNVEPQLLLENVDEVNLYYDVLDDQGIQQTQTKMVPSPDKDDTLQARIFGLRSSIRSNSGVVSGKVVGRPRFDHPKESLESLFFVQATPYSVFLKLGAVDTLAWVVDLHTGEPIKDADVELYLGTPRILSEIRDSVFSGLTNSEGFVSLPGYETFDPYWDLGKEDLFWDCRDDRECPMYFLRVEGTEGIALLPLDDSYTIQGYVFQDDLFESIDHWATTPQDLYLPGDTVHIKGFVRTRRNDIRAIPGEGHFGLCVLGPNHSEIEVTPLSLNEFGSYHTSITLRNNAELGEYEMGLVYDAQKPISSPCLDVYRDSKTFKVLGGSFTVFEFKTNPIRVTQTLNAEQYEFGDQITTTTRAEFHAGGPYANASGQVDVWLLEQSPSFENLPKNEYIVSRNRDEALSGSLIAEEFELDSEGKHVSTLSSLRSNVYYGELRVDSSVLSDRGKSVATHIKAPYFGVDRFVGIRRPELHNSIFGYGWGRITIGKPWSIEVLVVSKDDEISIGTEVRITVWASQNDSDYYEREDLSLREVEWEEVFDCTLVSSLDPVACDFTPPDNRFYYVIAELADSNGNSHISTLLVESLVERESRWVRNETPTPVELELNCGTQKVNVGDTIRCDVKNHVGNSPILVTIERTSVIDHWLIQLDPKNPVIEFPVLEHYEPHFELSVLNVFPRSATDNHEDRRYRIASTEFTLDNPRLVPLGITVSSNRDYYQPRDKVKLSISIDEYKGTRVSTEFAVAVIDEALLDLNNDGSLFFDPTKKTWKMNASTVQTYGLIAALIEDLDQQSSPAFISPEDSSSFDDAMEEVIATGTYMPVSDPDVLTREERESDPNIRKVDRFVAYWNPSVVSDNGRLKLDFALPDNLTSWRVLVMVVSAEDRFGYAETTFVSLKDTEVRPVVPNVVTEGDIFQIGASILNRADRRRRLTVEFQALGDLLKDSKTTFKQQMSFEPFERKLVTWDVEAGSLPQSLNLRHPIKDSEIQVIASARDRRERDALDIRIPVRSNKVRVSSVVYGALAGDKTTIPIGIPSKLATDNGQLDFTLSTNKAVDFDGVFRYAIEYPYSCWEQQLTQAVLAMQYVQLEKRGAKHGIQWSDPEGLIRRVLDSAIDYQTYGGGMDYFMSADQSADPYLSVYTTIAFSWLENAGYDIPQEVTQKLLEYLRDYVDDIGDLISDAKDLGNKIQIDHLQATMSAAVLHALAIFGELKEADLVLFSDQVGQMDLFGLSQYLMASITLDPTHSLIPKIFEKIMNRRSLVDGAVEFVESVPHRFSKILHSDTRSLCSIFEALTKLSDTTGISIDISELNELSNSVRFARESQPYWRNTQDNVYCTTAMITFFDYVDSDVEDLITSVALRSDDTGITTRLAEGWKFNSNVTKLHTQHTLKTHLFGTRGAIDINRQGSGTAFYNVELSYLTTVNERINRFSGFEVHREYVAYRDKQWHILEPGDEINKGEYVLVNLYLNNRFVRYHVVLEDSVPGGLEPVNLNLKTEFFLPYSEDELEEILSQSELFHKFEDARFWDFRYRELGLQKVRYFSKRLNRGKHHLLWLGQAISAGEFTVLPTHVEEMYRPVMFGKSEPWTLKVNAEPR